MAKENDEETLNSCCRIMWKLKYQKGQTVFNYGKIFLIVILI